MGFKSISPRFKPRQSAAAPLTREQVLAAGTWIDTAQASHFNISEGERRDAWLTGEPLARARDWLVDHTDPADARLVYRRYALAVHAMGWSGFPERRDTRAPAVMVGHFREHSGPRRHSTRYFPTLPSERRDVLAPFDTVLMESGNAGAYDTNLALVMGPASLHTRALDLDILDAVLAEQVHALAVKHLGPTPFVRVGRAPKMLLVYRVADEDASIPTKSYAFLGEDGQVEMVGEGLGRKVKNAIEFLGQGRNFTAYGLHHKTGQSFDWSRGDLHPAIAGPDQAPLVTRKQLNDFYAAVDKLRPLSNYALPGSSSPTGAAEVSQFEKLADVWFPKTASGDWVMDGEGYVIDGRESFMSAMTWQMMSANVAMLADPATCERLRREVEQWLVNRCVSNEKRNHESMRKEAGVKWRQKLKLWTASIEEHGKTGRWLTPAIPFRLLEDGSRPFAQHAPSHPRPADGSLDWLPEQPSVFAELSGTQKVKGLIKVPQTKEQIAANKADRALVEDLADREAIHARVAREIDAAAGAFLATIGQPGMPPLHILKAPTGAGKTTRVIGGLGQWLRDNPRGQDDGPVMMLMPSHDNIAEALGVAERTGMIVPNPSDMDEREIVAELDSLGVKAMVFSGKRNHCNRKEDLVTLNEAGIGTEGLCGVNVGATDEVLCPFRARGECGYWTQQSAVATADVVFLPHSYLTMHSLPKVLKGARAVIVDESVVYRLIHQSEMPLDTLTRERGTPFVTKTEKKENPDRKAKDLGEDMEQRRSAIAEVVIKAVKGRKCPAQAVLDAGIVDYIGDAIKVVTRSHAVERDVTPNLTAAGIAEFAKRPAGLMLHEEEKFWRLLQERVDNIRTGVARGDSDARIFLFFKAQTLVVNKVAKKVEVPYLRLSWRSEMNWETAPKLLLDASASPEIIEKCSGSEVTVHDVQAPLHVRTVAMIERPWATRAFLPPEDADRSEIDMARETIRKARALITKTAVSYSHGRVLVGATIAVREVLSQGGWVPPPNVDWVHFGALRGLDFAKHHVAAISIGRSEQPIGVIDGYAAALTYDDAEPEKPYDLLGTGLEKDGSLLFRKGQPRRIPMRSGHDIGHLVPQVAGKWGRILEAQWREEELRQFLGRLRPVYRGGAPVAGVSDEVPVWLCMSSTLPPDITVDEIFTLDDMIAGSEFHDLMRVAGGVLGEGITGRLPSAKRVLSGQTINGWTETVLAKNLALRERLLASMHTIRARVDGTERTIRIAAWHDDPGAALRNAIRIIDACNFRKVQIEVLSVTMAANERVTASAPRKPDRIDQALADMAPFGDGMMLLEDREAKLGQAVERITAAGRDIDIGELEQKWRRGAVLEDLVDMLAGEYEREAERATWVRTYDGEELFEIQPHWLDVAA